MPLSHLIGREFRVDEAVFRGVEISEPCQYLVEVTGLKAVLSPLIHRGGLKAAVVLGGVVRVGDTMVPGESLTGTRTDRSTDGKPTLATPPAGIR